MSNHVHVLLEIATGEHLPKFMQLVLQGYARWYGKRHSYSGHVWQGRYKSPLVEKESYYLEAGRYIERNPIRTKLVQDLKDYPWSSYLAYAYGQSNALVDEDPYYVQLGKSPVERQTTRLCSIESLWKPRFKRYYLARHLFSVFCLRQRFSRYQEERLRFSGELVRGAFCKQGVIRCQSGSIL